MKRFVLPVAVALAIGFGAQAASAATKDQSLVSAVLEKLKFVFQKPADGRIGGDQKWRITEETIKLLQKHKGKDIILKGDGSILLPGDKDPDAEEDKDK